MTGQIQQVRAWALIHRNPADRRFVQRLIDKDLRPPLPKIVDPGPSGAIVGQTTGRL